MSIEIVAYDEGWPSAFLALAQPLRQAVGGDAARIDHIGSTSVPGLAAKDVIDVQVTVVELAGDTAWARALASLGYREATAVTRDHVPALAGGTAGDWEKRYFRPPPALRRMHLHVRAAGRANQRYPLLFRDYLRSNEAAATTYGAIKTTLAARHGDDVDYYYAVKDPVCDLIIGAAEEWAARSDWRVGPSDA